MLSTLLAMLETEEDRERFLKLHGAYEKKLYAVAARVLGDRTAAEDAVQQTWLQIIRRWDRVSQLPWSETEGYRGDRREEHGAGHAAQKPAGGGPAGGLGPAGPGDGGERPTGIW